MWSTQYPHKHSRNRTDLFHYDKSVEDAMNYCRDPDMEGTPWCYTTNKNKRWEHCDIPLCKSRKPARASMLHYSEYNLCRHVYIKQALFLSAIYFTVAVQVNKNACASCSCPLLPSRTILSLCIHTYELLSFIAYWCFAPRLTLVTMPIMRHFAPASMLHYSAFVYNFFVHVCLHVHFTNYYMLVYDNILATCITPDRHVFILKHWNSWHIST